MGGNVPRWRHDGKELFHLFADQKLMAVPITVGASVQIGKSQELFTDGRVRRQAGFSRPTTAFVDVHTVAASVSETLWLGMSASDGI
jgi:Zn-dependent M32 family carboxypeptidase